MKELFAQLGIDWRLLISQAANFLILLVVLRLFAYKPIMQMLKDRKTKIEEGLKKAEEADHRLNEANVMVKDRLKEADQEAMKMLRETETKAKVLENQLLEKTREKESEILANAKLIMEGKAEEAKRAVHKEAAEIVKAVLVKTVELDPKQIDDALITKAAKSSIKQSA